MTSRKQRKRERRKRDREIEVENKRLGIQQEGISQELWEKLLIKHAKGSDMTIPMDFDIEEDISPDEQLAKFEKILRDICGPSIDEPLSEEAQKIYDEIHEKLKDTSKTSK